MFIFVNANFHPVATGEIAVTTPDHWVVIFSDAFRLRVEDLRCEDRRIRKMHHLVLSDLALVEALKLAEVALHLVVLSFPLQMQGESPLVFRREVAKLAFVGSIEDFFVNFLEMPLEMAGVTGDIAALLAGKLGFNRFWCGFVLALGRVGSFVFDDMVRIRRPVVAIRAFMRFVFEMLSRMRFEISFVHRCVGALIAFVQFKWDFFLLCLYLFFYMHMFHVSFDGGIIFSGIITEFALIWFVRFMRQGMLDQTVSIYSLKITCVTIVYSSILTPLRIGSVIKRKVLSIMKKSL